MWYVDRILAVNAQGGGGDMLTGIGASPGRYTGTVRIIRSEAEFDRLRAGDVLVCPATSPVWSVLFPTSAHWSPTRVACCPIRRSSLASSASPLWSPPV